MVPRLYKQGKTTEQRSEKVTATSVRKAAGSQGSWFEKKENKKIWLAIVTRSWDDSLWLGWCSHCCSLGKMSSKTILLLWVNTWTEIATARGSCYCYRVVFCRTYLPWSGRVIHSLPQARCKTQFTSSSLAEAVGDDLPACRSCAQAEELCSQVKEPREGVSRLHSIRDGHEGVDQTFSEIL